MERLLRETLVGGAFGGVPPDRSQLMGRISSKGNKTTELRLRLALVRAGIAGWQMHPSLVGCPDFYFHKARLAIFVDGCFWHGCKRCGHVPKTRREYWEMKFRRNNRRARIVARQLRLDGIKVVRFWEHDVKQRAHMVVSRITRLLNLAP